MVDKAADVKGLVVRPLCGKLMPKTIAEEQGLIKRELMCDFNGRSRKPQMALAEELGQASGAGGKDWAAITVKGFPLASRPGL